MSGIDGIELVELDRANCCGAGVIAEHNQELADTLNARTFAMAQRTGLPMMNICSTCQGAQSECEQRLDADSAYRAHINEALSAEGLTYEKDREGFTNKNFLWVLVEDIGLDTLRAQVKRPLTGLRVGPFYGCYILRPKHRLGYDEHPDRDLYLDFLIEALGGEVVSYDGARRCCGFPVITMNRTGVGAAAFLPEELGLLESFAAQAAIAIDNAGLYRAAADRATRLRTLARLNHLVTSSLDLDDVLATIARAAGEIMRVPFVAVWVVDDGGEQLQMRTFWGTPSDAPFQVTSLRVGEGLVGAVAAERRPVEVADLFEDGRFIGRDWARAQGFRSARAVPILHRDTLLGVLVLAAPAPIRVAADEEEDLLQSFTAQAAAAIHNARLYQEARANADRLRALDEGGVETTVLYPTLGLFASFLRDRAWAVALCRAYNTLLHEEFTRASPRLRAVALLPLQDPEAAARELGRAVRELGCVGGMLAADGPHLLGGTTVLTPSRSLDLAEVFTAVELRRSIVSSTPPSSSGEEATEYERWAR